MDERTRRVHRARWTIAQGKRRRVPGDQLIRYHEADDLRRLVFYPLIACAATSLGLLGYGVWSRGTSAGWASVAAGIAFAAFTRGIWRAREWARLGAGILSLCIGIALAWLVLTDLDRRSGEHPLLGDAKFCLAFFVSAVYLLGPKARAHFALVRELETRDAAARARAEPVRDPEEGTARTRVARRAGPTSKREL